MKPLSESTHEPLVLYDVELIRVNDSKHTLIFRHDGCALAFCARNALTRPVGAVGRLTLHPTGEVGFLVYADPRLRRAPEFDSPEGELWTWRLGEHHFSVRAGVLPGANGAVIEEDVEQLERSIPREFIDLCARFATNPKAALRDFIADVCGIRNCFVQPREDDYSFLGSDERESASA